MNKLLTIAIFLIFLVLGLFIGAINLDPVTVNFYWLEMTMPIALFAAIVLIIGIFISWLSLSIQLFKTKRENSRLQSSLEKTLLNPDKEN